MLAGKQVLLTGGTGFLGSRLAERLAADEGAKLRVLMRDAQKATKVGRYPIQMCFAELSDREAVEEAAQGCAVIFHLAHDVGHADSAALNREAAENVVYAARSAGARLVYVSSAQVYGAGFFGAGELTEDATKKPTENRAYAESKLEVERLLQDPQTRTAVDVVILQPSNIYGPYSKPWVEAPIARLKTGWVLLPENGEGSASFVFVDDVVEALVSAAVRSDAAGESFLIAGPDAFTWGAFYERLESIVGKTAVTYAESKKELAKARRAVAKQATVELFSALSNQEILMRAERIPFVDRGFEVARQRLPGLWRSLKKTRDAPAGPPREVEAPPPRTPPPDARVHLPSPYELALYRSRVRISNAKAERVLGYRPRFDFETSLKVLEEFAEWAYLVRV